MLLQTILLLISVAIAWSPTNSYAPGKVSCPGNLLVRVANSISPEEQEWVDSRNKITDEHLIKFLDHANMTDFDADSFIHGNIRSIKIGIAFSGGGLRASIAGSGQLAALDNRTDGAWEHGSGGLLQATTYISSLSGGSWLVGTVSLNNFSTIDNVIHSGLWDFRTSIFSYGGLNLVKTFNFMSEINQDLEDKRQAGFETSLVDVWARALSYQFFKDSGKALTWSSLQDFDVFKNHEMPFPMVIANGRTPESCIINGNSTVFEVNPYELGSWDPSLYQFTQVKYLGTNATNGLPTNGASCIGGYDNAGFILGTSSSLFNEGLLRIDNVTLSSLLSAVVKSILLSISQQNNDVAVYKPNPFFRTNAGRSHKIATNDSLFLCDGGEDAQNIPLYPLIQPEREVDVIFAYDNSANFQGWPNGAAMVATFERQFSKQGNGTHFPYVPDTNTFLNMKLTAKPTFFGCDASNLTSLVGDNANIYDIPLIVYTANRPFSTWSNTSTFQMRYDNEERDAIIKNGFETSSRMNLTLDPEWNACVGCAIIRREQERQGIEQSEQCKKCFQRYCWNGHLNTKHVYADFVDRCIQFLKRHYKSISLKAVQWVPSGPLSWLQYIYSRIRWFF
ncbi:PLB3 Lysophospholipase 3 [Candida maltosa Xu316]